MLSLNWYRPIHIWLVKNSNLINQLFKLLQLGIFCLIVLGFIFYQYFAIIFYDIGKKAGSLAVLVYILSLSPGILIRLRQLPLVRVSLMLFRRELGVLAFLLMLLHSSFVFTLPHIQAGISLFQFNTREFYGVIALWLLIPLWITSNNFAVTKLRKFWSWLHRFTYISLFFIMAHVAWMDLKTGILLSLVLIAELVSWVNKLSFEKTTFHD